MLRVTPLIVSSAELYLGSDLGIGFVGIVGDTCLDCVLDWCFLLLQFGSLVYITLSTIHTYITTQLSGIVLLLSAIVYCG